MIFFHFFHRKTRKLEKGKFYITFYILLPLFWCELNLFVFFGKLFVTNLIIFHSQLTELRRSRRVFHLVQKSLELLRFVAVNNHQVDQAVVPVISLLWPDPFLHHDLQVVLVKVSVNVLFNSGYCSYFKIKVVS